MSRDITLPCSSWLTLSRTQPPAIRHSVAGISGSTCSLPSLTKSLRWPKKMASVGVGCICRGCWASLGIEVVMIERREMCAKLRDLMNLSDVLDIQSFEMMVEQKKQHDG
jgi:hypothetical protein